MAKNKVARKKPRKLMGTPKEIVRKLRGAAKEAEGRGQKVHGNPREGRSTHEGRPPRKKPQSSWECRGI